MFCIWSHDKNQQVEKSFNLVFIYILKGTKDH